jgi:PAS domain S-box-containing protein
MGITRRADGTILHANELLGGLLALQHPQLIGRRASEFYCDPADREAVLVLVKRDGFVRNHELCLKAADGAIRWVALSMRPATFDGESALISGFYDVTARKEAEDEVRESEERWRSLSENAPVIIATVDREGTILATNRTLPPFSLEQVVGTRVYDYIAGEHHERVQRALEDTFEARTSRQFEVLGTGPVGTAAWYDVRLGPRMRHGGVASATWIATDVTEQKRSQDELREREELYVSVVENVSEIIFMVTVEADRLLGPVQFANARTNEILGLDSDRLVDRPAIWYQAIHRGDRTRVATKVRQAFADGQPIVLAYRFRHGRTGKYVWLESNFVPRVDGDGRTVAFLGVTRDITERKREEKHLKRVASAVERSVEGRMPKEKRYDLTFREMTVLQLVASGQSDKEIAATLNISVGTTHVHVANVLGKMDARSRTEAAVRAVKEGLAI